MDWIEDPLWRALAAMRIEPEGAALGFAARLARENGWTPAFAASVVEEYRRFLYLAATVPGPVTPSEPVDQAWHLHLGYSRHYWDVLCGTILERPFHHEPTAGGAAECGRYRGQYAATLTCYRATFGAAPPPAIWPNADERFSARPLRIDASRYWLVPRSLTGRAAGLAAATLLIAACAAFAGNAAADDSGYGIVPYAALGIGAVLVGLAAITMRRAPGSRRDGSDGGCGTSGMFLGGDSGCGGGCGGD